MTAASDLGEAREGVDILPESSQLSVSLETMAILASIMEDYMEVQSNVSMNLSISNDHFRIIDSSAGNSLCLYVIEMSGGNYISYRLFIGGEAFL